MKIRAVPGKNGDKYIPYSERTGEESVVFFTRDLSEEGMKKIYAYVFGGCDELREVICGPDVEISPDAYKIKPPYSERQWGGFTGR